MTAGFKVLCGSDSWIHTHPGLVFTITHMPAQQEPRLPRLLSVVALNALPESSVPSFWGLLCPSRKLATAHSALLTLAWPFLVVKQASADDLNAWSLETFFDRTMMFIWAMVILLTMTPWYIGFISLVRFA